MFVINEDKIWKILEQHLLNGWMVYYGNIEQIELLDMALKEPNLLESEIEEENFRDISFTHFIDGLRFATTSRIIFIKKSKRLMEFLNYPEEKFNFLIAINVIDLLKPKIQLAWTDSENFEHACKEHIELLKRDFKLGKKLY